MKVANVWGGNLIYFFKFLRGTIEIRLVDIPTSPSLLMPQYNRDTTSRHLNTETKISIKNIKAFLEGKNEGCKCLRW